MHVRCIEILYFKVIFIFSSIGVPKPLKRNIEINYARYIAHTYWQPPNTANDEHEEPYKTKIRCEEPPERVCFLHIWTMSTFLDHQFNQSCIGLHPILSIGKICKQFTAVPKSSAKFEMLWYEKDTTALNDAGVASFSTALCSCHLIKALHSITIKSLDFWNFLDLSKIEKKKWEVFVLFCWIGWMILTTSNHEICLSWLRKPKWANFTPIKYPYVPVVDYHTNLNCNAVAL